MLKVYKDIYSNTFFHLAMLVAVIGGLLSDQYGIGYLYVFTAVLICITLAILSEKKKFDIYSRDIIPIPIVIKVDDGTHANNAFRSLVQLIENEDKFDDLEKNLNKYFSITKDELVFEYKGDLYDEKKLVSFFQIIRYAINRIESRLENRVVFHLAYYRRPAIGFMIGTIFRTDGMVVYQRDDANDRFNSVAKIDSRRYKEKVERYEKFLVEKVLNDTENIVVIIDSASHKVSYVPHEESFVHLTANNNGTITLDDDWIRYGQEIYNVINDLQVKYKSIKIIHAMPEALSVIVGMAIENYWPVMITQYDNGEYKNMIKMNNIKFYF